MRPARLLAVTVLAVVLALSVAMPASAHINLLQNPGFETGSLAPWVNDGGGTDWGADMINVGAHGGTYWVNVWVEEADASLYQKIGPPQCAQYLELWYQGYTNVGDGMGVEIHYSDGSHLDKELSPTQEWSFVHIDLDTAKLVKEVDVGLGALYGAIGVDDFDLEACPTAVGGIVTPVNAFAVLAPWLAVIGLVGCIGTVIAVAKTWKKPKN